MSRQTTRRTSPGRSLFFPTNQNNVRSLLSSGLLGPRNPFGKHYPDLRDLAPGYLPLIAVAPSPEILGLVSPESDETLFPVCIEIPPGLLTSGTVASLVRGGLGAGSESDLTSPVDDVIGLAGPVFFPIDERLILHFPSSTKLIEWNALQYDDLRTDDLEVRVSPELFNGTPSDFNAIQGWLSGLPALEGSQDLWLEVDRASGSSCLLLQGGVSQRRGPIESYLPYLEHTPCTESTATLLGCWMETSGAEVDSVLSGAIRTILNCLSHHNWKLDSRAPELFGQILGDAMVGAPDDARQRLSHIRDRGQSILRNEAEVKPRTDGADGLSDLFRALLLTLQDPNPKNILTRALRLEEPDQIWGPMLAFSGALWGLSGLPSSMKPKLLFQRLSNLKARALAGSIPSGIGPMPLDPPVATSKVCGKTLRRSILLGDLELIGWDEPLPSPLGMLDGKDLLVSPYRQAAVDLCRDMNWEDLIWSEIVIGPVHQFEICHGRKEQVTIRVKLPEIPVVFSVEGQPFLDRLADHEDSIPREALFRLLEALGRIDIFPFDGNLDGPVKSAAKKRASKRASKV